MIDRRPLDRPALSAALRSPGPWLLVLLSAVYIALHWIYLPALAPLAAVFGLGLLACSYQWLRWRYVASLASRQRREAEYAAAMRRINAASAAIAGARAAAPAATGT